MAQEIGPDELKINDPISVVDEALAAANTTDKERSVSEEVTELQIVDSANQKNTPEKYIQVRKNDGGARRQNTMINIPELETDSVERTILHIAPLVEAGNYMNSTNLDLEARFNLALNTLDMFNPVAFSQCALQGVLDLQMAANNTLVQNSYLEPSPPAQEPTRVSAYAKLIFEDGYFYMNTLSVILGRDLQAWHAAIRKEKRKQRQLRCNGANNEDMKVSTRVKCEGSRYSRSIVSESGGILRAGNDSDTEERVGLRRLRKRNKAHKTSRSIGSSSPSSKRDSTVKSNKVKVYEAQNLQSTISQTDGPVPVDPATFRPSPHDCPLVAIHPPATAPIGAYKSISREHVKIAFNSRKSKFEAHIIGRNGCFVQDQWYHTNDVVPLQSGDFLQVGGITVQFMLPNQLDSTNAEYSEHSDLDLSSHKQSGRDEFPVRRDRNSVEISENHSDSEVNDEKSCDEYSDDMHQENEMDSKKTHNKTDADNQGDEFKDIFSLKFDKKRGPGRPPKNGILSKREQKLLKKEDQAIFEAMVREGMRKSAEKENPMDKEKVKEKEKSKSCTTQIKTKPKDTLVDKIAEKSADESQGNALYQHPNAPTKNKVGRPRKNPLPNDTTDPPREKRKYTKRKQKEPKDDDLNETKSAEDIKSKKEKIPSRFLRSPSPVMREEDFTAEQLAKPQANYVTLIHEAISNSPTQQLGLPDIYRAICRKYPYFKFRTQTLGWQSSVRHNLSQHHAFRKVEKDGKGWTWGIVDGIPVEKERKKKATPPPHSHLDHLHQNPYQTGSQELMGNYPYGAPPGYQNMQYGQYSNYILSRASEKDSTGIGLPPNLASSIPLHLNLPHVSKSYHSPYAPKKVRQENIPQKTDNNNTTVPQKNTNFTSPSPISEKIRDHGEESPLQEDENKSKNHQIEDQEDRYQSQGPKTAVTQLRASPNQERVMAQPNKAETSSIPTTSRSVDLIDHGFLTNKESSPNPTKTYESPATMMGIIPSEDVLHAAEAFKKNLLDSLKSKQSEIMVNSAINRVLGLKSQNESHVNPQEEMIMSALRSLLSKIPGSTIEPGSTKSAPQSKNKLIDVSVSSSQGGFQNNQASNKTTSDGSKLAVSRPNFSVNRPPVTIMGPKSTNLDSSIRTLSRKSAPSVSSAISTGSGNEANTGCTFSKERDQVAGQKRPYDDSDEIRDLKKLTTSRPPQLKT